MTSAPTSDTYQLFQTAFEHFNKVLFDSALPPCLITFQRQKRLMGYVSFKRWYHQTEHRYIDELAINPEYFAHYSLVELFQTLCHEMVHLWQAHFGSPSRRGYHNEEWARKMIAIGLMPSTTGKPGGNIVGEAMLDYILADGAFLNACEALLATGLRLEWVDAYPVAREPEPIPAYNAQGENISHPLIQPKIPDPRPNPRPAEPMTKTPDDGFPYSMEQLEQAFMAALPFQDQGEPGLRIPTTRPLNKSHRHKYYCQQCHLNVWGRPELNILCGDCELPLVEFS